MLAYRLQMLLVLACAAGILLVSLGVGFAVERRMLGEAAHPLPGVVTGLICLTVVASWVSLVAPLNGWAAAGAILAGAGLLLLPSLRKTMRASRWGWAWIAGAVAVAFVAAGPPLVYDTGFYHAQAVRWINEYPAVPGLANLHGRLAFNSSWFVWAALWDQGPLDGKSYHLVNVAFWLAGWALCLQGLARLKDRLTAPDLVQASLLFPLCRFEHYAASLSPELPAHVLLVYAFSLLLRLPDESAFRRLVLVTAFLPTVKLSMAPALLLIPAALWLRKSPARPPWGLLAGVVMLVIAPFLARNVVLSGYLLFPFEKLDLFSFDWKVPPAEAELLRLEVRGWAIEAWVGPDAARRPLTEWFGPWLGRNLAKHPVEIALLALGPALALLACRKAPIPVLVPLVGTAFWFASAPDVRFGYSWILLGVLVPAAVLLQGRSWSAAARSLAVTGAVAWVVLTAVRWGGAAPLLTLSPLPTVPMRQSQLPDGLRVEVPAWGDRAWNAPLPNTPLLNPRLRGRGESLRHGFRQTP